MDLWFLLNELLCNNDFLDWWNLYVIWKWLL